MYSVGSGQSEHHALVVSFGGEGVLVSIKKHTNCTDCEQRSTTEWSCLSSGELRVLDNAKIDHTLPVGDIIYNQGDRCNGIYCVQSGLIGLRRVDSEGHSVLMRLINHGETIGYRALLSKSNYMLTAEVMMPSRVCFIARSVIHELLEKNPALGMRFLDHSLRQLEDIEDRVIGGETWPVRTRFLHTLLVLYERFGIKESEGWALDLPISRRDLAELVGTTPETMSRTISAVQSEGLARIEGRRVFIPNIDAVLDTVPFSH
jgi:CRP/FNR family transcriptional regulator, anaerobic regulatory protein